MDERKADKGAKKKDVHHKHTLSAAATHSRADIIDAVGVHTLQAEIDDADDFINKCRCSGFGKSLHRTEIGVPFKSKRKTNYNCIYSFR